MGSFNPYELKFERKQSTNMESQEERLKRTKQRYEQEQEKFRQMHMELENLTSIKADEESLKSLLGVTGTRSSSHQPEAIRKLLTGTVEVTPKTTPEKSKQFGYGYNRFHPGGSPKDNSPKQYDQYNGGRRSSNRILFPNVSTSMNMRPNSRASSKFESDNESTEYRNSPLSSIRNNSVFRRTVRPDSVSPDTKRDKNDKYYDYREQFNEKEDIYKDIEEPFWKGLGNFYYSAPAFENFQLDFDKILAALN